MFEPCAHSVRVAGAFPEVWSQRLDAEVFLMSGAGQQRFDLVLAE